MPQLQPIRRDYALTPAGQIHYRRAGDPAAPALLLLHQTASCSAMFEPLMRTLSDSFYLVAPDSPGFGQSDDPDEPLTMDFLAGVMAQFLAAVELPHCRVFGHHTGAAIAAALACRRPALVEALALCGPTAIPAAVQARLRAGLVPVEPRPDGSHLTAMWQRIRAKDPDAPLALSQRETLSNLRAAGTYLAAYEAVFAHDFAADLAAVRCPTLLLCGDRDPLFEFLGLSASAAPAARTAILPGGGTYVCERMTAAVAAELRHFFRPLARQSV
jgi:pimeloyl-ACP methyl ester carboxylesterase